MKRCIVTDKAQQSEQLTAKVLLSATRKQLRAAQASAGLTPLG